MNSLTSFFDIFEKEVLTAFDGVTKALKPFLPYNIYKDEKGNVTYEIAVAGYNKNNLRITVHESYVNISAQINDTKQEYLYKGISSKHFDFTIPITPLYEVKEASLDNGLLKIVFSRSKKESSKEIPIK